MTDSPADWAIKAAFEAAGLPEDVEGVKHHLSRTHFGRILTAHARLIEQTQPAPVDRKLLVAREAAGRYYDGLGGYEIAAGQCREGLNDEALPVVVEAINLWESGYAA